MRRRIAVAILWLVNDTVIQNLEVHGENQLPYQKLIDLNSFEVT